MIGDRPGAPARGARAQRPPLAMIVDDSLTVRKVTSRMLTREGFDVSEVRSGRKPGTRVCTVNGEPNGVATLLITHDRPGA